MLLKINKTKNRLKPLYWIVWCTLFAACCSLMSCRKGDDSSSLFAFTAFEEGDIVFRRGTGWAGQMVLAADKAGCYSHIGIMVKEGDAWKVVHAVPGEPDFKGDTDRVKKDDVSVFFQPGRAKSGAVMRIEKDSLLALKAAKHALKLYHQGILFDHSYNLADTTKMYCTELVDYVFRKQGIDLTEGRMSRINVPGFRGDFLFPSDIQQSSRLCLIYCY